MDFITLITAKQKDKKYSDKQMSDMTGINEYTYYGLKKYRLYLSKVAYYAICGVLELPILEKEQIKKILEENHQIVGNPETNMSIAAEFANPAYVEKLEIELSKLKATLDNIDEKNKVINNQYLEIDKLRKELVEREKGIKHEIQQAYSDGVKEGKTKIENMKYATNQQMVDLLNEEYTRQIDLLEKALKKSENQYISLYKYISGYIRNTSDCTLNLNNFEKPLGLCKEELGLVITEEMVYNVMFNYHQLELSVEDIAQSLGIRKIDVEDIIFNYIEIEENGVKKYVQRS